MNLLATVEEYVSDLLMKRLDPKYFFHHVFHTTQVVEKAMELASDEKLSNNEMEVVLLAAWFHDTGYIYDAKNHEEASCAIAAEFLLSKQTDEKLIKKVCLTILSTRMPQQPGTKLDAILCDADLHHLGSTEYSVWNTLLRKELFPNDAGVNQQIWILENIAFFENHHYFTGSANKLWSAQKLLNLEALRKAAKISEGGPH